MSESQNEAIKLYTEMKKGIESAGGSFFQYRACNLNADTIYDLENIKNGVVYARSPLYMNDPFDSMIGYSSKALYQELCDMIVSNIPNKETRAFMSVLLKDRALGKMAEFISTIKNFQFFLRAQKNKMSPKEPDVRAFAIRQRNNLFKMMSPALKKKIKNIDAFCAFAIITANADLSMVTEQNILQMLQLDDIATTILDKIEEVKTQSYIPQLKEFLSTITVSCFSASGWDNQLMWSHYANSYCGICIEYDFSTVNGETGFVFPVTYSAERPTISLRDLGYGITAGNKVEKVKDINVEDILYYLRVKNKCWEYEKEWRIINIGQKDTPVFIKMPHIKSITLGLNINTISKHLLFDICRDKGIPCYNLVADTESFTLNRELIDFDKIEYDMDEELSFIHHILDHILAVNDKLGKIHENDIIDKDNKSFNSIMFINMVSQVNDILFYIYCFKNTMNSFMRFADETVTEKTYNALRNGAKQVDDMINQLDLKSENVIGTLNNLRNTGYLSLDNYQRVEALLKTNQLLYDKASGISWDNKICPKDI